MRTDYYDYYFIKDNNETPKYICKHRFTETEIDNMEFDIELEKILDDTYCEEKNKEILNSMDRDELYENLCGVALTYIKPYDSESYQEFMDLIAKDSYYRDIERNNIYIIRDVYFWIEFAKNPL
jgi:hypothetical protein